MSAPTKTLDGLQPVVVNAVARASLHGVKVDFRFAVDSNTLEIVCFSGDKKVNAVIDLSEIEDHGQALIAVKINTILADHFIYDTAKNKALESELLSYKQAVHQLSFQLEMLKDLLSYANRLRNYLKQKWRVFVGRLMKWTLPLRRSDERYCGHQRPATRRATQKEQRRDAVGCKTYGRG